MNDNQHKKETNKLDAAQLHELRTLITGLDQSSLERLQKLMTDPHEFAIEISELLPFSIKQLLEKGSIHLSDLLPVFEEMIQESIEKNPQRLANLLFPIMGPAIRKAVSEDVKRLIESLNQGLESGLSPKHIKWRLQALFSKKKYIEIMLANAYLFQVKHVFLIHRQSALLLHHQKADHVAHVEADMVASMLSAISDFIKDSFHSDDRNEVETIKIGETNLWIEQGPHAIIAAVVDGNPPPDLRIDLKEAVEAVHYNHRQDLEKFHGETKIFEHTSKFLKSCLRSEKKEKKKKQPVFALLLLLAFLLGSAYLVYQKISRDAYYRNALILMQKEPGYFISSAKKKDGTILIKGLKDNLARKEHEVFGNDFLIEDFSFDFTPHVSLDSLIIIRRAEKHLSPPNTVSFTYRDGVLSVSGSCEPAWKNALLSNYHKVWGVHSLNTDALNLNEAKQQDLNWIIDDIMKYRFVFEINQLELTAEQAKRFNELTRSANFLDEFNRTNDKQYKILVQSVTSRSGNYAANQRIAMKRAQNFTRLLREAGVPEELLEASVVIKEESLQAEEVRSVSFVVVEK
jgi:OOP family OmpA-OmpF porin